LTRDDSLKPIAEQFSQIDAIDDALLELLQRRFEEAREVGRTRHALGQPTHDPVRSRKIIERFVAGCVERGLEPAMGRQLISVILAQTIVERLELFHGLP